MNLPFKYITVTAMVKVPVEATEDQIREWVHFNLHSGSIANTNPLGNYDMDADGYITIRNMP